MSTGTRISIVVAIALLIVLVASVAGAQVERAEDKSPPAMAGAVPIERVLASVAKRANKKLIVDPKVRGEVSLIGQEPASIDYPTLLLVLRVHGFAAVEVGGYVHVIPDANVRQFAVPLAAGRESFAEGEYVNRLIPLKTASAAQLVPVLRPLLPQVAHLVAYPCKNTLLIVDTFANVKRIEQIARALDTTDGQPFTAPSSCFEKPPG